jgi:hypothetical protein
MIGNCLRASTLLVMERNLFLALTASDQWLTAPQIVERLTEGHYWESKHPPIREQQRLGYVIAQLESLKDPRGNLLFASVEILDASRKPTLVYKQVKQFRHGT